jgi:hypothetical protein
MSAYVASFDRIGRNHLVPDLNVHGNADDIAEQVHRYARTKLGSRDVEVQIDIEEKRGAIYVGMCRPAGNVTLTEAQS